MNKGIGKLKNIAGAMNQIGGLVGMLKSQNGEQVAQNLAKVNPQFAEFYSKNANRSVTEIAKDYGIDMDEINEILKML